jgi:penicillin-binding protein 1C
MLQASFADSGKQKRWRLIAIVFLLVLLALFILDRISPLPLPTKQASSVLVTARDGQPLRAFASESGVWRYPVKLNDVSPLYVEALLGYEDRYYYYHLGVNPVALMRAAKQRASNRRIISGGSTITMQVARIFDPHPKTIVGKLRQIFRALQLEWYFSKDEILEMYLTYAPFGGTIEGVEAASWAYLGKSSKQLSHSEAALLAVLPQTPSRLRPDRNPEAARVARDKVLKRLADRGIWTAVPIAEAKQEAVVTRRLRVPLSAALLAQRLREANPKHIKIQSTIDANLQATLEDRLSNYFSQLPERSSAALLVVDNQTMEAVAYVGSLKFGDDKRLGHVDMVRAIRSPGSTLKPFLYGLAIDDGLIHSGSLLVDAPQDFGDYRPANFDPVYHGPVSATDALQLSLNVPAVDLLDRVGPTRFAARMQNSGMPLRMPNASKPNLSIILGGTGVRLEELVGAYAALNRNGVAGRVRYTPTAVKADRRVLSDGSAWIIREILETHKSNLQGEQLFDTSLRQRVAWKTGTSYGFRDAWALGSTPQYTVGVWVGRPDGTPMPGQYGAITALPLMHEVFDSLPRTSAMTARNKMPSTVKSIDICWPLGKAVEDQEASLCHRQHKAYALANTLPPTWPDRDARAWNASLLEIQVDATSGLRLSNDCARPHEVRTLKLARWPSLATPWLSASFRQRSQIPALSSDCQTDALAAIESLKIDGPAEKSTLMQASNSNQPVSAPFRALGTQNKVSWLVNGEFVASTNAGEQVVMRFGKSGVQKIIAMTDEGAWDELTFFVLK